MARLDEIAGAFLRYLYESTQFRPEVAGFLAGPHSDPIDPPVTVEELSRVLTLLRSWDLVSATGTPAQDLPVRAGLTGSGLICAGPYHGDVHAWRGEPASSAVLVEEREQPTEADSPHRDDEAGEVIRPRQAPEPTTRPEPEISVSSLGRVARVLLLTLPSLGDGQDADQRVRLLAHNLLTESQSAEPDENRARHLATMLRTEISTGPVAGTLGVVLVDGLDDALGEGAPKH